MSLTIILNFPFSLVYIPFSKKKKRRESGCLLRCNILTDTLTSVVRIRLDVHSSEFKNQVVGKVRKKTEICDFFRSNV